MRYSDFLLGGIIICSAFGGLVIFFNAHSPSRSATELPATPLIMVKDITLREYDQKTDHTMTLEAKEVLVPLAQDAIPCNNATVTITKKDSIVGRMHVAKAIINRPTKIIACSGGITGTLGELNFNTNSASYSFSTQQVELPEAVTITGYNSTTRAARAHIDITKKIVLFDGGVCSILEAPTPRGRQQQP
jgi:hypothetical protein